MPDETDFTEETIKDLIENTTKQEDESLATSSEADDKDSSQPEDEVNSGQDKADDAAEEKEPSELEKRAMQYGLKPEHFVDEQALQDAVTAFDRQIYEAGQQQYQQQYQDPGQYQQQPQYEQQQQQLPAPPELKFEFPEDLDVPEELQDSLNKGLQSVAQHYEQQLSVLAQAVVEHQQWVQQQQQQVAEAQMQQLISEFDEAVSELNRPSTFGKGEWNSLEPNSNEAFRRQQLAEQVEILGAGYDARGVQRPAMKELVDIADRMINGDERDRNATKAQQQKARRQAEKRTGGVRPSVSTGNVPDDPVLSPELRDFYAANSID